MSKTTAPNSVGASPVSVPIETQEKLLKIMMRRQGGLSLRIAALFLLPLLALPWINQMQASLMNSRFFGFSFTWFLLGIGIFPLTWLVSAYFVHRSDVIEAECTAIGRELLPTSAAQDGGAGLTQDEEAE